MFIKVPTEIIIEVKDKEMAGEAVILINAQLDDEMRSFPHGDVLATNADSWERLSEEQMEEMGFDL